MNRADVTMLLNRRRVAWDLPRPDNDTLTEWCRVLLAVDPIEAFAAVDRLVETETKPPSPARIIAEIRQRVPAPPPEAKPIAAAGCTVCEGTGFMYVDDNGGTAAAPCYLCRPDHGWHKKRTITSRHPSGSHPHFLIMEGAEERKAAWHSPERDTAYPTVLRRQFPHERPMTELDVRERMARIPRLPTYPRTPPEGDPPTAS